MRNKKGEFILEKYEYKFIQQKIKLGSVQGKNKEEAEKEWNDLGKEGWRFCREDEFGRLVFIRRIIE